MEAARSARQLEAAGAAEVTFEFRGTPVTIPLPIEAWPLDAIRANKTGRALKALLGSQRPPMKTHADAVELSHRMADACGVTPLPETPADTIGMFGAVPTLLRLVDNHGDDIEADLRRFYGIDYRAGVTLRQVWVFLRRIAGDSAILAARNGGKLPWTRAEMIAARTWEAWVRKPYPGRPPSEEEVAAWLEKQAEAQAANSKMAEREAYYASGQNMRDAGIDTTGMSFDTPDSQTPPQENDPVGRALAVARRNAARSLPKGNNGDVRRDDEPGAGFRGGRWDPAGSGWGG
ncbi:hypothetical protein ACQ856_18385 [Mycolicibacterium psychrotolerans]|uniref:hypothetical protein n=1 Tax=Mycolicibacterium psychrotolerans TaxID=216929 RepID=UPI003D66EE2A